jgi:hypothetical protein
MDDAQAYLARLPRNMVQNAMKILAMENPVTRKDVDHYDVVSLRTPSRRVQVYRRGDVWHCRSDKRNTADNPCSHILAVQITNGEVERPNTAAKVWSKGQDGRNKAAEEEAWRRVPVRVPELLAELLRDGLPACVDVALIDRVGNKGRPSKPLYAQCYQSVIRVAWRNSLNTTQGAMSLPNHVELNPYGGCSRSTLSRFHIDAGTEHLFQKLIALSTAPFAPYEAVFHPDGTGLTEQHFTQFFEEKHHKKAERREHQWNYAVILWSYRYTAIAALRTQKGPFGEAPWLIPLLERTRMMMKVGEVGGDKAYNAYNIDAYLAANGIDSQIKVKDNANPTYSSAKKKAYKRRVEASRIDPEGFAAKANRRNNAEVGNHAFKAILGDQIYSKDPLAQKVEILCMALAYNLTRLVFLEVEQGIKVSFAAGAEILRSQPWQHLEELYDAYRGRSTPKPQPDGPALPTPPGPPPAPAPA